MNTMKSLNQERGFTIVETIVAQVVLVLGALCVWNVYMAGTRFNAESEDRTVAANIAQLQMEKIMNTRFRHIVAEHPASPEAGVPFESEQQGEPFWTVTEVPTTEGPTTEGAEWILSLPDGRYKISYPDGEDADPLRVMVTILWNSHLKRASSLSMETLVAMTPGSLSW